MFAYTEDTDIRILINVLMRRCEFYLSLAGLYLQPLTEEQLDAVVQTDYLIFGADELTSKAGFGDIPRYLNMDLEIISDMLEELSLE